VFLLDRRDCLDYPLRPLRNSRDNSLDVAGHGPIGSEFRSTEQAKLALQEFRRAQAEAEIRCF
jgi:hypothetical protein